jgi:hypothetical protein
MYLYQHNKIGPTSPKLEEKLMASNLEITGDFVADSGPETHAPPLASSDFLMLYVIQL